MANGTDYERKWKRFAPLGLACVGFGVSVTGHAIELKIAQEAWTVWGLWGTLGLILLNAGIALFGEAVKARTLYEWKNSSHDSSHESAKNSSRGH